MKELIRLRAGKIHGFELLSFCNTGQYRKITSIK